MMMILLFALGFAAFAIVNALVVVGVADHLTRTAQGRTPAPRGKRGLVVTKVAA